jgi:hypothetical protein
MSGVSYNRREAIGFARAGPLSSIIRRSDRAGKGHEFPS